jgi:hypothetical protein
VLCIVFRKAGHAIASEVDTVTLTQVSVQVLRFYQESFQQCSYLSVTASVIFSSPEQSAQYQPQSPVGPDSALGWTQSKGGVSLAVDICMLESHATVEDHVFGEYCFSSLK